MQQKQVPARASMSSHCVAGDFRRHMAEDSGQKAAAEPGGGLWWRRVGMRAGESEQGQHLGGANVGNAGAAHGPRLRCFRASGTNANST